MKYLGIDFGLKRIGLAVSDGQLASPLKIIEVRNLKDGVIQIVELSKAGGFDKVIVGKPEGKMGQTIKRLIKTLKNAGLDVEEADETLSSQKALVQAIESGSSKKKRKFNDDIAAALILQNWLDEENLL